MTADFWTKIDSQGTDRQTRVDTQQEDAITLPTLSEKTAIGQVADWNAPDIEVKDIDLCLQEPTEREELAVAPTNPVGGEQEFRAQVKTPAARSTKIVTKDSDDEIGIGQNEPKDFHSRGVQKTEIFEFELARKLNPFIYST